MSTERDRILKLLADEPAHRYCPACIALTCKLTLEESKVALAILVDDGRVRLNPGRCSGCGRDLGVARVGG